MGSFERIQSFRRASNSESRSNDHHPNDNAITHLLELVATGKMSSTPTSSSSRQGAGDGPGRPSRNRDGDVSSSPAVRCVNPASDVNARLDTQVEVRVYPCNNSQSNGKKKFTTFTVRPEVSSSFLYPTQRTLRLGAFSLR